MAARMPVRTKEEEVLQQMSNTLNTAISNQSQVALFGGAVFSAGFMSDQMVAGITDLTGIDNLEKVGRIMRAVKSHIITQPSEEEVTRKFNKFVLLLRDELGLDVLADLLARRLAEKKPEYHSPLNEAISKAGVATGGSQTYSHGMTADEVYSWLLTNNFPQDDCEIIKAKNINGMAFQYITEDDWKSYGISVGGLILLKNHIAKLVNTPSRNSTSRNSESNGGRASVPQRNGAPHRASGCGSVPTVREFISFPMASGKVNLAERIGVDYNDFGILLLNDDNGDRTAAIERELRGRTADINKEIFSVWVKGKGRTPVSWATLVDVLQDMGLRMLARDIREIKCSGS